METSAISLEGCIYTNEKRLNPNDISQKVFLFAH